MKYFNMIVMLYVKYLDSAASPWSFDLILSNDVIHNNWKNNATLFEVAYIYNPCGKCANLFDTGSCIPIQPKHYISLLYVFKRRSLALLLRRNNFSPSIDQYSHVR